MSNYVDQIRIIYDSSMKRLEEAKKVKESWRSEERGLWRYLSVLCTATLGFSVSLYDPIKFQNNAFGSSCLKFSWFMMILCIVTTLLYLYVENWVYREVDTINTLHMLEINDARSRFYSGEITEQEEHARTIASVYFNDHFSRRVDPSLPSFEYGEEIRRIAEANRENLQLTRLYRPEPKGLRVTLKRGQPFFKKGAVVSFVLAYSFLVISFTSI